MFQIRLRKKRKAVLFWAKKWPHSKRRRTTLSKSHSPSPRAELPQSSNSPLNELFRHEAMWLVAYHTFAVKSDLSVSANELLSTLEGFVVNNDPKGASEFHGRVRRAWQDNSFYSAVYHAWRQNPDMVEGLCEFSKKCAAEERVAAMVQDPALSFIMKATKSDMDPRDNAYVTLRGLLSILFVYWNDGDDLEKAFFNIKKKVGTAHDEARYEGFGEGAEV